MVILRVPVSELVDAVDEQICDLHRRGTFDGIHRSRRAYVARFCRAMLGWEHKYS